MGNSESDYVQSWSEYFKRIFFFWIFIRWCVLNKKNSSFIIETILYWFLVEFYWVFFSLIKNDKKDSESWLLKKLKRKKERKEKKLNDSLVNRSTNLKSIRNVFSCSSCCFFCANVCVRLCEVHHKTKWKKNPYDKI